VSVARATDGDLGDLIALRYRWRTEDAAEVGVSLEEFERTSREWFDGHRGSHVGYVARSAERAIACAWLCVIDRVPGPGKFVRRGGMLQSVYVEPASRDAGVGSRLLDVILEDARAMGLDYVIVHPSARSFEFYRRAGFAAADRALELRFDAS
jgi:GNAT superfamily N-acetyltransferase